MAMSFEACSTYDSIGDKTKYLRVQLCPNVWSTKSGIHATLFGMTGEFSVKRSAQKWGFGCCGTRI